MYRGDLSGGKIMKVIGIVCSPRRGGNTEILVREALVGAKELGVDTELLTVAGKDIRFCDSCYACITTGVCRVSDDVQEILEKLQEANGVIFGTPVYFSSVSGQAKSIMDRTIALRFKKGKSHLSLKGKAAGAIVVARTGGRSMTKSLLENFIMHGMLVVGVVGGLTLAEGGWVDMGKIKKDKGVMKQANQLGRRIAMVSTQEFKFPEEFETAVYRTPSAEDV